MKLNLMQIQLDAPAASYYAGVINFRNRNFNEAVADFRRIEKNPTYQNQVPNWIAQSLYRQRRYDDLLAYTEPLLKRNNGAGLGEVALLYRGSLLSAKPVCQSHSLL